MTGKGAGIFSAKPIELGKMSRSTESVSYGAQTLIGIIECCFNHCFIPIHLHHIVYCFTERIFTFFIENILIACDTST